MSIGTLGPLLMLGIGAIVAVGMVVRLIRAARRGRTRAEFRSIGSAISGAAAVQSSAYGWTPSSLNPMEGPSIASDADDTPDGEMTSAEQEPDL